ncbi:hypothetical protein HOY80DRAFT_904727 [Tuber brumale]|nr:hypothetical protein HOY80DRAFT_904727 [Tuber brumale]
MAPSITSEKLTLSYPLFGASFIDADRLLVAGGGGEGRSGVGNKITVVDTLTKPGKPLTVASEIELSKDEDAVMSLSALSTSSGVKALVGINSPQRAKSNKHFRVFDVPKEGEISLASKHALFSRPDAETYQRLVRVDGEGKVAVIASGSGLAPASASEVVVIDVSSLSVKRRIQLPGKEEVGDMDISRDGKRVAYCSPGDIYIASTEEEQRLEPIALKWKSSDRPKGSFRSVRFSNNGRLAAVYNLFGRSGAIILLIDPSGEVISRRNVHSGVRAVTSMDSLMLSPTSTLLAVAGADQSVQLFLARGVIKAVKTFKDVHPFQITKLAFSPLPSSGTTVKLATISMGNTVVVFYIPVFETEGGWQLRQTSVKLTAFLVLISLVGVVVFAIALQLMFNARAGFETEQERAELGRPGKSGLETAEAAGEWVLGEGKEAGAGATDDTPEEAIQDAAGQPANSEASAGATDDTPEEATQDTAGQPANSEAGAGATDDTPGEATQGAAGQPANSEAGAGATDDTPEEATQDAAGQPANSEAQMSEQSVGGSTRGLRNENSLHSLPHSHSTCALL